MDVVYKMEAEGMQSGTPKSKVVIADSGELPLWLSLIFSDISSDVIVNLISSFSFLYETISYKKPDDVPIGISS